MTSDALRLFEVLAVVRSDRRVTVNGIEVGEVVKNRFTGGKWFAYKCGGERLQALDSPLAFETRKLAVRALIEAAEEALTKGQPK